MLAGSGEIPRSLGRIDGVDVLRRLAILLVLFNHVNMRLFLAQVPYAEHLPRELTSSLVWNGQPGVQIFFCVSGFLITATALRRWGSLGAIDLRGFYLMRTVRLAPLLLLVLAILSVLHFAHVENFVVSAKTGGLAQALLAAFTFRVNVLEARLGYLPGNWDIIWSLSVEEVFYLFFPLAAWLLGRGKLFPAMLAALVAAGPFARTVLAHGNEVWREYSYLGGMDAIALGCITALLLARWRFAPSSLAPVTALGIALMALVLWHSRVTARWGLSDLGLDMTLLAVGTCLVIAAAAQSTWKAPHLLAPVLALGRNSYEIYLTHMFVVFACFAVFVGQGKPLPLVPWLFATVIACSALLGWLVARCYSEPLNRLIRAHWGLHRSVGSPAPHLILVPVASEDGS